MASAIRIDGKAKAAELSEKIKEETAALTRDHGITPGLAVVIIGEDPASQVYVRNKKRTAEACGFHSVQHSLPADVSQEDVLDLVQALNEDEAIHGILVQLPLPDHLDEQRITQSIAPSKDVDGFHYINIGKLTAGDTADAFVPCTPAGCMLMIEDHLGRRNRPVEYRRQTDGEFAARAERDRDDHSQPHEGPARGGAGCRYCCCSGGPSQHGRRRLDKAGGRRHRRRHQSRRDGNRRRKEIEVSR
jgi:hypothetical protein